MPDKDKNSKTHIVVEGAQVSCTLGVTPQCPLKVDHKDSDKYLANGKKIATWVEDKKKHLDFKNCKVNNNLPACNPNIKWKDYYDNAEFGNQKVLTAESTGTCTTFKGTVSIKDHGQRAQPSASKYKNDLKNDYTLFMINPALANRKDTGLPAVNGIRITYPLASSIPRSRELAFEIGGTVKEIILEAHEVKGDKSRVSWAVYKGDSQKDRIKTYLEHGSILKIKLEDLPQGKTLIFGYGKTPSGDLTKIIINQKKNQLEAIKGVPQTAKFTPVIFSPVYTFEKAFSPTLFDFQKPIWRVRQQEGSILYSSDFSESLTSFSRPGLGVILGLKGGISLAFLNSGTYTVEYEDRKLRQPNGLASKKSISIEVRNRAIDSIINKGQTKIRSTGSLHLQSSGVQFDSAILGLGKRAFWYVQKDGGKPVKLGLAEEIKMSAEQLKSKIGAASVFGVYTFQVFGEDKTISKLSEKGGDIAVIEVAKNRTESIEGPLFIPIGAKVKYKARTLMPLAMGEQVEWEMMNPSIKKETVPGSTDEIYLTPLMAAEATLNISLKAGGFGNEVSEKKLLIPFKITASQVTLNKALWCYKNGKRRAETGWDEENYAHITLKGLSSTPVKISVWAEHPQFGEKERSFAFEECLLKEIPAVLDAQGSCQVSFIADKETREKIDKIWELETTPINVRMFFTLEFTAGELLDLTQIKLENEQNENSPVPIVTVKRRNQHLVLDPEEVLRLPAEPRITAINFSNEAADDIQIGVTRYGIKHHIWVHTVGMPKEKLTVKVYKTLLAEDMAETYNKAQQAFQVSEPVQTYPSEEVGVDGILDLEFTPEKKEADGDPQLFYIVIFKEIKDEEDKVQLVEAGSQLKTLDALPYNKELSKDAEQVGISMPTLEEGQTPTADQLKKIVSQFFHFYNPLYVSEFGTIETEEIISPVLVERGTSKKDTVGCPRCKEDFTPDILKKVYKNASNTHLVELSEALNKYKDVFKLDTCARKAHFFAQSRQEASLSLIPGLRGESFNYYKDNLAGDLGAFRSEEGKKKAQKYGRQEKEGLPVSETNQIVLANWAYGYQYTTGRNFKNIGENDGWNFRGRGLFQITGRSNYKGVQEKINAHASNSGIDIMKKYDSPDKAISIANGWMTPEEAALTAVIDWFKKGMYLKADDTGKLSDDQVVLNLIEILNPYTSSKEERKAWYRGGSARDLVVSESDSTKSVFKVSECGKTEEALKFSDGKWHDPVDNPQRTKYNSDGTVRPQNGAYGNVRNGGKKHHSGLDLFALPDITPIYACVDSILAGITEGPIGGKVIRLKAKDTKSLLKRMKDIDYRCEFKQEEMGIEISESDKLYFIYMHLTKIPSKILYTKDDIGKEINAGEIIGYTGVSGNANGIPSPHLHLEVATVLNPFNNGGRSKRINPARLIKLNSYDTKEQNDAAKIKHFIKTK